MMQTFEDHAQKEQCLDIFKKVGHNNTKTNLIVNQSFFSLNLNMKACGLGDGHQTIYHKRC